MHKQGYIVSSAVMQEYHIKIQRGKRGYGMAAQAVRIIPHGNSDRTDLNITDQKQFPRMEMKLILHAVIVITLKKD